MTNSGGQDAVREPVMRELRASIRERKMRGVSTEMIHDWIDRREADGESTEEEGAIARLISRHYSQAVWEAVVSGVHRGVKARDGISGYFNSRENVRRPG